MFSRLAGLRRRAGDVPVQVMCRCREQADNEGWGYPLPVGLRGLARAPTTHEGVVTETQF